MTSDRDFKLKDLPIGIDATGFRAESDSMGSIQVPADRYWGAQTERSLQHFSIGEDRMPKVVYHAYGYVKKAAAFVNAELKELPEWKAAAIIKVSDEIIAGKLDDHFPLFVWQTGSGTQSNMNVNEVISNRAIQLLGGVLGSKTPIHPNDDVNKSQSSNDTFPTAMHIATVLQIHQKLLPSIEALRGAILAKSKAWKDIVKIGRTHLQDAVPLTFGQEWSAYSSELEIAIKSIHQALPGLYELAMGGTAVGTGLNAPKDFAEKTALKIAEFTKFPFVTAANKFAALSASSAMVRLSGVLRNLAACLIKMANDVRWLGSGPRCGLHELILPENEPGSSIMPGKVNPTQAEAMLMVCTQVMSLDAGIAFASAQGNFELNTFRPLIIANVLHQIRLLSETSEKFRVYCIEGIKINQKRVTEFVNRSLMLVTALTPVIGYDKAAAIAHKALEEDITLREAAIASKFITAEDFDKIVIPSKMVGE